MIGQSGRPAIISIMIGACEKAARGLLRDFNEVENLQISQKSIGNFVSTADKRSEQVIMRELQKARPHYSIISEESEEIVGDDEEHTWIIDPLDGTTNFIHNIPHFAITIALKKGPDIIAGVTYDPLKDEIFWAQKGKGAYLNYRRVRVSTRRDLNEALMGVGIPNAHRGSPSTFSKHMTELIPNIGGMRRSGVASLDFAYVAAGRLDAYLDYILHPWDVAAGHLLVKEAGGFVQNLQGKSDFSLKQTSMLASNANFNKTFRRLLLNRAE
jgi:myo-inositol-1(or 4)-monophosphatase